MKNNVPLYNRYVVPYNAYLSKKYNAHINVEICSMITSCKYLYKYVYKGPDMASVAICEQQPEQSQNASPQEIAPVHKEWDEIKRFVNARFVTASKSYWRIFDVHGREQSIQRLAIHEQNLQTVVFNENNIENTIANPKNTTLLAWFKLNQIDPNARHWKYHEIPEHYVWQQSQQKWMPRKQGRTIGSINTTNPSQGERHYLHILLHHIHGATSYDDLKTTLDGITHTTFKETAIAYGLLESDKEWNQCLFEAAVSFMP